MRLFFIFLLIPFSWGNLEEKFANDLLETVKKYEGIKIEKIKGKNRIVVYKDSKGFRTVGYGFNLDSDTAKSRMKNAGINYEDILHGKKYLTSKQAEELVQVDINTAIKEARAFTKNFNQLPYKIRIIIVDMAFNMGLTKLNQFKRFKAALKKKNYSEAAKEMKDSKWFTETGNRAKNHYETMLQEAGIFKYPLIKQGSKNEKYIKIIQKAVGVTDDGDFGTNTKKVFKNFKNCTV